MAKLASNLMCEECCEQRNGAKTYWYVLDDNYELPLHTKCANSLKSGGLSIKECKA